MTAYWELLKDPRWQRLRLEVMSRDLFTCVECNATDKTLNVHHTYYAKGRKPWEYEPESLRTLCEDCHSTVTDLHNEAKRLLGTLSSGGLEEAVGYLRGKAWLENYEHDAMVDAKSHEQVVGLCEAFGIINREIQHRLVDAAHKCEGALSARALHQIGGELAKHLETYYAQNRAARAKKTEEGHGSNPND